MCYQICDLESGLLCQKQLSEKEVCDILDQYHCASIVSDTQAFVLEPHMESINKLFSGDTLEEICNRLLHDNSEWALKQLKTIQKMSPTSLKVRKIITLIYIPQLLKKIWSKEF